MTIESLEEFKKMLRSYGVRNTDWRLRESQIEMAVPSFGLAWLIWKAIMNPDDERAIRRTIEYYDDRVRNGFTPDDLEPSTPILKSWIEKNIDSAEIATVIRDHQLEAIFFVLQIFEQMEFGKGDESYRYRIVAERSDGKEINIEDMVMDIFMSASPSEHPPIKHYV